MPDEGLQIDTHGALAVTEHEHNPEEVNQDSVATTAMDPESLSEKTDESPIFDDSDKIIHDHSPTTPIHPEHEEHNFEKDSEDLSLPEPFDPETRAEKSPQEPLLSEETDTKTEHLNQEQGQEISIPALSEDERSGEEPVKDLSTTEPPKEDEAQYQPLPTTVDTEDHIEDAVPHHAISITTDPENSKENMEEKPQDAPESSIAEAEGSCNETIPDPSHADKVESGTSSGEEMHEPPEAREKTMGESAGKELPDTPRPTLIEPEITAEIAVQESQAHTKLKEPITIQIPEASKESSKPTSSDREKRALDVLKRSRYQFRVAIDVFLQLINENEDDEGVIRLNLVERDSDLRKIVGMLGLKLQNLTEAEKDLDWVQLLDKYEAKKEQE